MDFKGEIRYYTGLFPDYKSMYYAMDETWRKNAVGPIRAEWLEKGGRFENLVVGDKEYLDDLNSDKPSKIYSLGELVLIRDLP
jgi:hypothetical protein